MTHELKTWPVWFEMVRSGRKTFELRVNDRNFQCGDTLLLREWDPKTEIYTGSEERRVVADIIDLSPLSECVAMVFMDDAADTLRTQLAEARKDSARIEELALRSVVEKIGEIVIRIPLPPEAQWDGVTGCWDDRVFRAAIDAAMKGDGNES